jgi:hypothetical protein
MGKKLHKDRKIYIWMGRKVFIGLKKVLWVKRKYE